MDTLKGIIYWETTKGIESLCAAIQDPNNPILSHILRCKGKPEPPKRRICNKKGNWKFKAYRFMNPNDATKREYFLLENIQNKGWNTRQKGHGLLVYHVNYKSDVVNVNDYPNNVEGKPRMAVVPADGWLMSSYKVGDERFINPETGTMYGNSDYYNNIAGDPFPGIQQVTDLKYEMNLPNYKWQIGDPEVKQAIVNVREDVSTGKILFDFVTDITNAIENTIVDINTNDNAIYTLDGRKLSNENCPLRKGIYIKNNKKFIIK